MSKPDSLPLAVTHEARETCLCLLTQRAARSLARRFDEALSAVDLSSGQFSLLMAINRPAPPGMRAVAAVLAMDRTTLTANLKPLVRRGLVQVTIDRDDRRSRLLALTRAGRQLLAKAVPIWRRTHRDLDRHFSKSWLGTMRAGLAALS